jgi:hypothetical protein
VEKKSVLKPKKSVVKKIKIVDSPSGDLPEVEPYRFVKLRPKFLFARYSSEHRVRYLNQYHSEVNRLLPQLVRGEGPIHKDLAFKRINNALRLKRATKAFKDAFEEEMESAGKNKIDIKGNFLWPRERNSIKVRAPVEGVVNSFRLIEHIPHEEILMAFMIVVGHSFGIGEKTLLNETARLLGFKRISNNILENLRVVYREALNSGVLGVEDSFVIIKNQ